MALDVVLGRKGESLQGRVQNKQFRIRSGFGELTVSTGDIRRIDFKAPGTRPDDEIYLKNTDKLVGKVLDATIVIKTTQRQTVEIEVDKVLLVLIEWIQQR